MKISNNALNFLLAQYRAIFKRAYVKGIASAVILTAGLAAGQAHADAPYLADGKDHYFYGSTWTEASTSDAAFHKKNGITAGAIGGNGISGDATLDEEKTLTEVTGGELIIGGNAAGALQYIQSGTAAGGWASASTGNITAQGNSVTITGSGTVTKDGANAGTRGVVFGARANAAAGMAYALNNHITVNKGASGGTAAASHGFIGGQAQGFKGATASSNIVNISGTTTQRQVLSLSGTQTVIGGSAQALTSGGNSGTGLYTASQNTITLTNVSGNAASSGQNLMVLGGYLELKNADATTTSGVAQGNVITVTGGSFTFAENTSGAVIGASNNSGTQAFKSLTFSDNKVSLSDTTFSLNNKNAMITGASAYTDGTGSITGNAVELVNTAITASDDGTSAIVGASIEGAGANVTAARNTVVITDTENKADATTNKLTADTVAGAVINNTYQTNTTLKISATGNTVDIGSNVVLDLTDGAGVAGAYINFSGSKTSVLTANDNSVSVAGEITGDVKAVNLQNADAFATGDDAPTLSFLNNDVTLKTGGKVQSGSLVGGAGNDSLVTIENGATYIANKDANNDLVSDRIDVNGTVIVEAGKSLQVSGFYENGVSSTKFNENLTNIGSSAAIKNAGTINLYGKAVVTNGATLTATTDGALITLNGSDSLQTNMDDVLDPEDRVSGADFATLVINKSTAQSYLSADKVLGATTNDSEGRINLTSGAVFELSDTSNVDLATSFNFSKTAQNGAIQVDGDTANGGSVIRGNELTVSRQLASNAVKTSDANLAAGTYEGLNALGANGIKIEANVLHLGADNLTSARSEDILFGEATFRDQLTFSALANGQTPEGETIANDGYHLVSKAVGDHYSVLQGQGTSLSDVPYTYYEAQDGVVEGDATIKGDSGSLTIRNGNFTADGALTVASGGEILVGGDDGIDDNTATPTNAPDATLVLGQALTFDLSTASADPTVTVEGAQDSRYDADLAAETVGNDRHVVLDLRNGITLVGSGANKDTLNGAATIDVKSGGEVLLTASNLNSLLAKNADINNNSGSIFKASSGGAFIVEGDVDATFDDFNAAGTHGISLSNKGYLVANSLTIDNSSADNLTTAQDEGSYQFKTVDWGNGTVVVQDLEISDLQLTTGENKPTDANSYASYVTLAQGTAEIGSSLLSNNQTLKLGDADSSGNIILATDDAAAEGVINVERIQVDQGFVAAAKGVWDGTNTDLILSGSGAALEVGYGAGEKYIDDASASLTLNTINMTGENTEVNVYAGGSLFANSLSMAATSTMKVSAYGYAEFDSANFGALTTPADTESGAVVVYGHLKVNGDTNATIASGENSVDDPRNGVAFGQEGSLEIYKNGTLEFGLDAVNGAILNTSTTKTFNGSGSIDLDADYTKIANNGGTLKLDFAQGTVFDGEAIQTLKQALFTSGSFQEGVLKNGGILNIADGKFHGIEVSEQTGEGLSGYTATWESLKTFSDIYGNDVTNDQLLQTNVSGIKVDDNVQGHWASLSMASGVSTKAQVNLIGDTSLNYAAGNNGFFISDAAHQIALGAKVAGDRTLSLVDGGKIGTVSLNAADSQYEEETVLEVTSTGNNPSATLTTIAEIKGEGVSTQGVAWGTVANFYADTEVTGDITGIENVQAFNGTKVTAQNTAFVSDLRIENASIAIANKAQFGDAFVMGGTISAKNAEMLDTLGDEIAVVNDGWFKVDETLTAQRTVPSQVALATLRSVP